MDLSKTSKWAKEDDSAGAVLYARLATRLGGYQEAFSRVGSIEGAFSSSGDVARRYFGPEEMSAFATFLEQRGPDMLDVAKRAGLGDLEARWLYALLTQPETELGQPHEHRLIDLETRRMQFAQLAGYLEAFWKTRPVRERYYVLDAAAEAWHAEGDLPNELRVLEADPQPVARYMELLSRFDPPRFLKLAGAGRSDAVDQAMATGNPALAYQAIAAFGRTLPPVWTKAYTALAGLHDADRDPRVDAAFRGALNTGTVGQRLAKPANRDQELTGDVWFYYGSRYGEYLTVTGQDRPEDYLPASLEGTPANHAAYAASGDFYAGRTEAASALADYGHALELIPNLGYVQDHAALVLWKEGRPADAIARWKSALADFRRQQGQPNLAAEFWVNASAAMEHIAERNLLTELRSELAALLRSYVQQHEFYRLAALLTPLVQHGGLDIILDTASASSDPRGIWSKFPDWTAWALVTVKRFCTG